MDDRDRRTGDRSRTHLATLGHQADGLLLLVTMRGAGPGDRRHVRPAPQPLPKAASGHGVRFSLGGDLVNPAETSSGGSAELIGFVAAVVVLWPARRPRSGCACGRASDPARFALRYLPGEAAYGTGVYRGATAEGDPCLPAAGDPAGSGAIGQVPCQQSPTPHRQGTSVRRPLPGLPAGQEGSLG